MKKRVFEENSVVSEANELTARKQAPKIGNALKTKRRQANDAAGFFMATSKKKEACCKPLSWTSRTF